MSVSREAVIYAYRYLLNREPESEDVIGDNVIANNWSQLRQTFLDSDEFRQHEPIELLGSSGLIGRHLDADKVPVDISATPEQMRAMLDRIAACWRAFGETEPHWSVLTNDIFKVDHLAGHLDAFFEHGRHDVQTLLRYVSRAGLPLNFDRALDFGCGVGRMTVSLADYAQKVVGADISHGHLREAEGAVKRRNLSNVEFVELGAIEDIDNLGTFDLIISRIVLQHNPPPIMAAIYRRLLQQLRPAGIAVIQMPTFIQGQTFEATSYLESQIIEMEMNALPQKEIFKIISEEHCIALEVREDDHLGEIDGLSHTFAVMRL